MADFNYVKSVNTADKLIAKFGGKLGGKIIRPQAIAGTRPVELPPVEIPCTCVIVDYTDRERAGGSIKVGARRCLISPKNLPIELTLTDRVQAPDGQVYKIVSPISVLKPRDTIVLYDLQVET